MDGLVTDDVVPQQDEADLEDAKMINSSEEDEDTEHQSVDQEVLQQYLTVMNTLLGPSVTTSTSQHSTSNSTTPQASTEDAQPKSTVSAAKRRKMDMKKMKKEESKRFPSIVDFCLLSRTIKPISLLPPTEPLFIVPNPRHTLPSDAEIESLRVKAKSVAITWEDVASSPRAPPGYGIMLDPIRLLKIPSKWKSKNDGAEWNLPLLITELSRSFNPTPTHPSSSTVKGQQPKAKLKRHHPIPKSHTSCPVIPIKRSAPRSTHAASHTTSMIELRNKSTAAQTKAERRRAGRRIKARLDVDWKGKKLERKKGRRKLRSKMKHD